MAATAMPSEAAARSVLAVALKAALQGVEIAVDAAVKGAAEYASEHHERPAKSSRPPKLTEPPRSTEPPPSRPVAVVARAREVAAPPSRRRTSERSTGPPGEEPGPSTTGGAR